MALSSVEAQLSAQLLQTLFFGIYIVTFGACLNALLRNQQGWKKWADISKPALIVACLMAFFAVFDVIVIFTVNLKAMAYSTGGPEAVYKDTSHWINLMGTIDVIAMTILGDGMLIYRCWVVYGKSWTVTAVPLLIALAGIVLVILSIYFEVVLPSGSQFASPYRELVISTWAITVTLNILNTSLIVLRVWRVGRVTTQRLSIGRNATKTYDRVIRTIIESGLMYTVTACATAIAYISGSNAFGPLSAMDIDIIGIAFNLIIIRTYSHRAEQESTAHSASTLRFTPSTTTPENLSESRPTDAASLDTVRGTVNDSRCQESPMERSFQEEKAGIPLT